MASSADSRAHLLHCARSKVPTIDALSLHDALIGFLVGGLLQTCYIRLFIAFDMPQTLLYVSVFTLLLLCFRSEESLSVLLHLHHFHQGSVGWREDIGRLCSRIQGSSGRGIRKWLDSHKSCSVIPTTPGLFFGHTHSFNCWKLQTYKISPLPRSSSYKAQAASDIKKQ